MTIKARERLFLIGAFAVVYLVWGSTYLGIRIGVADLPPGLLAGIRNVIAGVLLIMLAKSRGQKLPASWPEWRSSMVMAIMLVVVGNGLVTWSEQWVPSNQAALIATTSAFWIALFGSFGKRGEKLRPRVVIGLLAGFGGAALMFLPGPRFSFEHLGAQFTILFSAMSWAGGAMYGRSLEIQTRPLMFAAVQMLIGGVILTSIGIAMGETTDWHWSIRGIGALVYLTIFGSCLAYTTYIWLIRHAVPSRLSTISYVNPAIAVLLGWLVLNETLTLPRFVGMLVILVSVVVVSSRSRKRPITAPQEDADT